MEAGWSCTDEAPSTCTFLKYTDYYLRMKELVGKQYTECQYSDDSYDQVNFQDIGDVKQKTAIMALVNACVVKGRGTSYSSYKPEGRVSVAELIKLAAKVHFLGTDVEFAPETQAYLGPQTFADIPGRHWAAEYVAKAQDLGWTASLASKRGGERYLAPNRSVDRQMFLDFVVGIQG